MKECTISFRYNKADYIAKVVRCDRENTVEYDIRPRNPSIVQQFGKQVVILKEGDDYRCDNHIDNDYPEFFNALVAALEGINIQEPEL